MKTKFKLGDYLVAEISGQSPKLGQVIEIAMKIRPFHSEPVNYYTIENGDYKQEFQESYLRLINIYNSEEQHERTTGTTTS